MLAGGVIDLAGQVWRDESLYTKERKECSGITSLALAVAEFVNDVRVWERMDRVGTQIMISSDEGVW
jgi:hypothetical protein